MTHKQTQVQKVQS